MKKITSFLLLLLVSVMSGVSAWAQVVFETSDAPTADGWAANTKWYFMSLKGFYVSSGDVDNNGNLYANKTTEPVSYAAQWCIVGDATNGYKLYNRQAGPTKVLGMSKMSEDGDARGQMCDASSSDLATSFDFDTNGGVSNVFYMKDRASNVYVNSRAPYFSNWTSSQALGNDGSQIRFFNAPDMVYVKSVRGYMYASSDHSVLAASGSDATPEGDDYKFVFYRCADGNYYLWSVGAAKFVHAQVNDKAVVFSDEPQAAALTNNTGNASYPYNITLNGSKLNHNSAGSIVTQWETQDDGNRWTFEAAEGTVDEFSLRKRIDLYVSSNYISNENVLGAYTANDLAALKPAYESANASFTIETASTLETAIADLVAKSSRIALTNNAVFKLKNAHSEKRGYLVYDETTPGYPNLASVEYPGYESLYGQITDANIHSNWGVYTSATSGKQYIYNIDNVKFLKPDAGFNKIDFSEDAVSVTLSDNPNVDYAKSLFWNGSDKALCMACAQGRNNKSAILTNNANDGGRPTYLVYQEGQTVSEDVLKIVEAEVRLLENGLDVKGYVGAYTDEVCANAQELLRGSNRTGANAETVLASMESENGKNQLQDGGYYRIINAVPGFNKTKGLVWNVNGNTVWNTVEKNNVNAVYQIIAANGKHVLKSCNAGKYIQGVRGAMNPNMIESGYVQFVTLGNAQFNVNFGNGTMHAENHGEGKGTNGNIVPWAGAAYSASAWYIVPATDIEVALTTIEDHAYATTCMPFPVSAVNGAKAYTGVLNADADAITLNEATGFAANEGVLLMGDANTEKAVLAIGGEAAKVDANVLQGTCSAITLTDDNRADYRVLGVNADDATEVGFFRPSSSVASIPANRAYLNETLFAGLAESLSINFGGMVEGIANAGVAADQVNAPVYDLTGRRVVKAVKGGVYIQNGKKFIVK